MNLKRIDVPLKVHVNRNQLLLFFSRAARVLSLNFFTPIKLHYAREQKKSRFCSFSALSGAPRCVFSAHCGCSAFCFAARRLLNSALLFLISSETLKLAQSRKLLWWERKRVFPTCIVRKERRTPRSLPINRRRRAFVTPLFLLNNLSLERRLKGMDLII